MKGNRQVIVQLNQALHHQLTAINQYFLHARMYGHWGLEALEARDYAHSIRAMKQADRLIERILFLDGLPNLQNLGKLLVGENPAECLACDLQRQQATLAQLHEAIAVCEGENDFVSRADLVTILTTEEDQLDWLETQHDLIARIGLENWLQAAMED